MPRLMLLRHAKSSWAVKAAFDFDRPLNPRGHRAAAAVGEHMARHGMVPDRILCSPARRARQTLDGILPALGTVEDTLFPPVLYDAAGSDYLQPIRVHAGGAASLLVIGHNSAIEDTALQLAGNRDAPAFVEMRRKYPTGALAVLDFKADWSGLRPGAARLAAFVRPADLVAGG